jgi:hypothetical protein
VVGRVYEPLFVGVVGGTGAARRAFVRRLLLALGSFGVRAGSLEGEAAERAARSLARPGGGEAPFWENEVVLLDGLAASTIPRIALLARAGEAAGEPEGETLATVRPPGSSRRAVTSAEVDRVARLLLRRLAGPGEVRSARERGLSS